MLVSIPLLGRIESLNVSVAAAVLLYEARRQRRGADGAVADPSLYLFDGYNLLHGGPYSDRRELVDALASFVATTGARGVVVFDGAGDDAERGPLAVRFAPNADTLLERLAADHRDRERVLLVSSDVTVLETAGREVAHLSVQSSSATSRPRPARRSRPPASAAGSTKRRANGSNDYVGASDVGPRASRVCALWSSLLNSPQVQGETSGVERDSRSRRALQMPAHKRETANGRPVRNRSQEPSESSTGA